VHNVPRQEGSPEQFHEGSVRIYIAVPQKLLLLLMLLQHSLQLIVLLQYFS
jgi:hypothetical protein